MDGVVIVSDNVLSGENDIPVVVSLVQVVIGRRLANLTRVYTTVLSYRSQRLLVIGYVHISLGESESVGCFRPVGKSRHVRDKICACERDGDGQTYHTIG